MARYKITDNQSGRTLTISGDSPPTEEEAEGLFQSSGIRNTQAPDLTQVQPQQPQSNPLQQFAGSMAPISNFLMPDVVKAGQQGLQQIGAGNLTPNRPTLQSVLAGAGGPITKQLFGTDAQKTENAAGLQVASTLQGVKGIANLVQGGLNLGGKALQAKSLSPSRIATAGRNAAAANNSAIFEGKEIGNAFTKAANDSPGGYRQKAMEYASQDVDRLKGSKLTVDQMVKEIAKQWNASHSEKGVELTKAQAQYALSARDELMKMLQVKAPEVAKQTKQIGKLIGGQKAFMKVMKWIIPPAIVGKALMGQ